ncbi:SAE2 domain-containing protein [Cephalotus follicularis]|uniref:SAE2 domain-containing protein n=1 Tax=Cephalotus follicularis TaxID=3775 RepID=A0A1Q3BXS2_CEPFO|nr:SAE2 domain-containing protein [Cephalotus follicularis]
MEGQFEKSPKLAYTLDGDGVTYVSGLSTMLVATIQEAKDRISQIEDIFCSQLYPSFLSRSRSLQKVYSEARVAAEDGWKEKESDLLLQLKKIELEKQQIIEENQFLKLEKAQQSKEQEEKLNLLLAKLNSQQLKIEDLERELMQKSKEVDEGMVLHNKLVQLVQTKATVIVNKCTQLKDHKEKGDALLAELNSLKKKVDELQDEIRGKTEEVVEGNKLAGNLLKKLDLQSLEIMNNEQLLSDHEKEKKLIITKLEHLEVKVNGLQEELMKRNETIEEGRKLQEQLLQQIDLKSAEMLKYKQRLEEQEKEENLLLAKIKGLEETIDKLQLKHRDSGSDAVEGRDSYEMLLQQIDLRVSELLNERKKKKELIDAYKRLKSQYNYLLEKSGYTTENMLPQNKSEDESDSLRQNKNPISPNLEDKAPDIPMVASDLEKVKNEINFNDSHEDKKGSKSIQTSSSHSCNPGFLVAPKCPSNSRPAPVAGTKRPASSWRETRSRQCQGGPDPHDDFLDIPFDNIRGNLNKALEEEADVFPAPVPNGMNVDSSDDVTQDLNLHPSLQQKQAAVRVAGKSSFKYTEPVRKKAERENLKGIQCKQCEKFYDAVLPNKGGKDADGNKQKFRCEHHDGVSRHRYRFVPPLTPEGFWNIGFESEM